MYPYYADYKSERPPHGNTPAIDSKQNVWTTLMWTNEIAKWDRKTGRSFAVHNSHAALARLRRRDGQE